MTLSLPCAAPAADIIDAIDGATFFLSTLEPTRMPDFEWISCFSMFFLNAAYFFMLMSREYVAESLRMFGPSPGFRAGR